MSPETELRIISTLDTSAGGDHEYLLQLANNMTPSDDHYRRMLQNHKKRKLVEPVTILNPYSILMRTQTLIYFRTIPNLKLMTLNLKTS